MSEHDEGVPYRLNIPEGLQPIYVAWMRVAGLLIEKYDALTGTDQERVPGNSPYIGLHRTGLATKESEALFIHHSEGKAADLTDLRDRLKDNLKVAGVPDDEAAHIINVFCLGVMVGREEAVFIEEYAKQGIEELGSDEI